MKRPIVLIILITLLCIGGGGAESLVAGGPYESGDQIHIRGDTNYNTDNKVLIEIFPASFGPTAKYESSMIGGGSAVVPVTQNEQGGFEWSATMSSEGWDPDRYMVRVEMIGKDFRETTLFDLEEKSHTEKHTESSQVNLSGQDPVDIPEPAQSLAPDTQVRNESVTEKITSDEYREPVDEAQTNKSPLSPLIIFLSGMVAVAIFSGKKRD